MINATIVNQGEVIEVSITPPSLDQIVFNIPPPERIAAEFIAQPVYFGGLIPGESPVVLGEIPTGAVNGFNAVFTTQSPFLTTAINVRLNGLGQRVTEDYQILNNNSFSFYASPTVGEKIEVDYIKL